MKKILTILLIIIPIFVSGQVVYFQNGNFFYYKIGTWIKLDTTISRLVGINLKQTISDTSSWDATKYWAMKQMPYIVIPTTTSSTTGVIYKGSLSFLHDFDPPLVGSIEPVGHNTFLGLEAGNFTMGSTATQTYHSSNNTGVGYQVLQNLTTGYTNTAVGYHSQQKTTSGRFNSSFCASSLAKNTTGNYNTAIGYSALFQNLIGDNNTAIGATALNDNLANNNTAIGYSALKKNTTGYKQVALGYEAGTYIADGVTSNLTGDSSVYIGCNTKPLDDNQVNQIVIGHGAIGNGSNTTTLGNSNTVKTYLKGDSIFGAKFYNGNLAKRDSALATLKYVDDHAGIPYTASDGIVKVGNDFRLDDSILKGNLYIKFNTGDNILDIGYGRPYAIYGGGVQIVDSSEINIYTHNSTLHSDSTSFWWYGGVTNPGFPKWGFGFNDHSTDQFNIESNDTIMFSTYHGKTLVADRIAYITNPDTTDHQGGNSLITYNQFKRELASSSGVSYTASNGDTIIGSDIQFNGNKFYDINSQGPHGILFTARDQNGTARGQSQIDSLGSTLEAQMIRNGENTYAAIVTANNLTENFPIIDYTVTGKINSNGSTYRQDSSGIYAYNVDTALHKDRSLVEWRQMKVELFANSNKLHNAIFDENILWHSSTGKALQLQGTAPTGYSFYNVDIDTTQIVFDIGGEGSDRLTTILDFSTRSNPLIKNVVTNYAGTGSTTIEQSATSIKNIFYTDTVTQNVSGDSVKYHTNKGQYAFDKPVYSQGKSLATNQAIHDSIATFFAIDSIGTTNQNKSVTFSTYSYEKIRMTGNITITLSSLTATRCRNVYISLIQDGVGSRIVTWAGNVKFPGGVVPVLSTTANAQDVLSFEWNGSHYILVNVSYNVQ